MNMIKKGGNEDILIHIISLINRAVAIFKNCEVDSLKHSERSSLINNTHFRISKCM